MSFLQPALLAFGLLSVAAPILIHILLRRRRKPIAFGAMRFLLEAHRRQRRRTRLEQILLLAARCLALLFAALAVGGPVLGGDAYAGRPRVLYLLVDNSLTSSAIREGEPELASGRAAALAALGALDPARGDRASLITLAGPAEGVILPPSSDLDAVAEAVRSLAPSDARADVEGAVRLAASAMSAGDEGSAVESLLLVSSMREGVLSERPRLTPIEGSGAAPAVSVTRPASGALPSVWIESARPLRPVLVTGDGSPTQDRQVGVRLRRDATSAVAGTSIVRVGLERVGDDGEPRSAGESARRLVRWDAGQLEQTATLPIELPARTVRETLVLRTTLEPGDLPDAIARDNTALAAIEPKSELRVAIIARPESSDPAAVSDLRPDQWVAAALDPGIDGGTGLTPSVIDTALIDRARLAGFDAAIVTRPDLLSDAAWRELAAFSRAGRPVLVTPRSGSAGQGWTSSLESGFGVDLGAGASSVEHPGLALASPSAASVSEELRLLSSEIADLVRGVVTTRSLPFEAGEGARVLLEFEDGRPALARVASENGSACFVLAVAIDLGWTDLPARPIFLPLIQELVRQGVAGEVRGVVQVAGPVDEVPPGTQNVVSRTGSFRWSADEPAAIRTAGPAVAASEGGDRAGLVLVNTDTRASTLSATAEDEVLAWLGDLAGEAPARVFGVDEDGEFDTRGVLGAGSSDGPIDWPLLVAALVMALVDVTLGKHASHAGSAAPRGRRSEQAR